MVRWTFCGSAAVFLFCCWLHPLKMRTRLEDAPFPFCIPAFLFEEPFYPPVPTDTDSWVSGKELPLGPDLPIPVAYFPPDAFWDGANAYEHYSYSQRLAVLGECSLYATAKTASVETYRFTWLRSFHRPISVRLEVQPDGSSLLTSKHLEAQDGTAVPLLVERTRNLSRRKTARLTKVIQGCGFWTEEKVDTSGIDGAQWLLEGARNGKYHLVDRRNPENGSSFQDVCLDLLETAGFWRGPVY